MTSPKSRLFILGGSGKVGKLVIDEALKRGFRITALVRSASSLKEHENLTIVEGTPLSRSDVERAATVVANDIPTVAISTLGQQRKSGSPWAAPTSPPRLVAESMSNLIAVAKAHHMQKIVVVSMFGTGKSFSKLNMLMRWIMNNSNMVQTVEDHNAADEIVRKAPIPFVLVRAAMLMGSESKPITVLDDNGTGADMFPSISAVSVAKFVVDATEQETWDRRSPVIKN